MISSVFTLKETDIVPEYLVPATETKLEENYYINNSLKFLLECHKEILSYRQDFYKTVLESEENNPYIINESFVDIISKIKSIIKKILAYIETIIRRFATHIAKFVKSDKYIIRSKKQIEKFPKDRSFNITGYNFTINDNIPIVDIVGLDLSEIRDKLKDLDNEDIVSRIGELSELIFKLSDEGKMDDIRGQILNVDYSVPESSFGNEIFSIYRDGKSEEDNIKINREDVIKSLKCFEDYKRKIKDVENLKYQISNKYKTLETQFNSLIKSDIAFDGNSKINNSIDSGKYSAENINKLKTHLNSLLMAQIQQIQRIANLHVSAVAAKLDAYNAAVIQDRNILYRALNIVQQDPDNTFIMRESYNIYDYTRPAMYKGYLIEKYFMDQEQKRFVEECLVLSEGNVPELKTIHEDIKMDAKNKFEKIKQVVKELFQKFLMKMNKLFTTDDEFLKKYKDIILTKKIEEYTLNNMPDYEEGIKNIKAHKLPNLDIKKMISESETELQKSLLPTYNGEGEFADFAKRYFLCDNKPNREEVKSTSLNMAEIYAFCLNAKAAVKVLENDQTIFTQTANKIESEVLNSLSKNEAVDLTGNKFYYSAVLESFINEEEQKADAKGGASLKLDVPSADNNKAENNNLEKDVKSDDKDVKDSNKQAEENNKENANKIKETATWYLNTVRTISMAKITAFQMIYKEYMKILRYHVSKATGSMGSASKFSEEDVKNIRNAMKEYKDAKDDNGRKSAAQKIINIYKSKDMVIDDHDVSSLVDKNKNSL